MCYGQLSEQLNSYNKKAVISFDMVCSPSGTTIEGVRILEKNGFRSAVFEALQGAADKGKKM